ncbi:TetR/AcrR family transcriptional regulator [Ferdinandcohnia quinoae]|uniref:TetR/AcrR family transcriptional regulator n=1 Tax=Fredinandcohnia quinoae TaxID=2918902 RepID=A0AAW5DWW3_9BACI|nr:TetR/AcrR family transcriptional regulator [Fredinandcohnia sp. SECRCQ15]MCH1624523.1 TetR/AcrR family transcriptional regulator [Fredinandcohnia sp. SECRCQ15]
MNNRKRKVADIALKLFIEKGFQQTSIQEIIEKANISKGTFYNYFTSKNDCIADILEFLRYDASQKRVAIQIGKDPQDRKVFIEQITILIQLNDERNLHALFDAILHSNETELKKLVLQHRVIEMEWLSNRMIEVMGEEIREYAFEGVVLFYGMLQHMLFTLRLTNSPYSLHHLADVILSYMEMIIPNMMKNGSFMLNYSAIDLLRTHVDKNVVSKPELIELAEQLQQHYTFNEDQQDFFDVIMYELQRERIRKSVLVKLLKPFQQIFNETPIESQVHRFTNMVWYYLKSI